MQPVEEEAVCEIAAAVWESMLGSSISVVEPREDLAWGEKLSSCVTISGSWQGVVVLDFSPRFGRRAASLMFGMDDSEVGESEVNDTIGELANMVGGSIKSLLPEPCQLGIPQIGAEVDNEVAGDDVLPVMRVHFDCEGDSIQVTLFARGDGQSED